VWLDGRRPGRCGGAWERWREGRAFDRVRWRDSARWCCDVCASRLSTEPGSPGAGGRHGLERPGRDGHGRAYAASRWRSPAGGAGVVPSPSQAGDGGAGDLVGQGGAVLRSRRTSGTLRTAGRRGAVWARRRDSVCQSRWRTCWEKHVLPLEPRRMAAGARGATGCRGRQEAGSSGSESRSGDEPKHWESRRTARTEACWGRAPVPLRWRAALICLRSGVLRGLPA
jgi:hypothetical protein